MKIRHIHVHRKTLTRLQSMVNRSDLFKEKSRPEIYVEQVKEVNDNFVLVECRANGEGTLDRLEVYARGLSDAFLYCK